MNGYVTADEFDLLMQIVEPQMYDVEKVYDLFVEYADATEDNMEYISIEKMAAMAVKYGLFGTAAQSRFLGKPVDSGFDDEFAYVSTSISDISGLLHSRLVRARIFDPVWANRLSEFEKRVHSGRYSHKCTVRNSDHPT